MLNKVGHAGVKVEARHHELLRKQWVMISAKREAGNPQTPHLHLMERLPLDAFLNQLGDVLDARCNAPPRQVWGCYCDVYTQGEEYPNIYTLSINTIQESKYEST